MKRARIPRVWFTWSSGSHRLAFYVKVYWTCRERGIRKNDREKVVEVMLELAP